MIASLLSALGPLLLQLGEWLWNQFVTKPAEAAANYFSAIRDHEGDAKQTVSDMDSSDQQIAGLKSETLGDKNGPPATT